MGQQGVLGRAALLVVFLAASAMVLQAEDAAKEKTLYGSTSTKNKEIANSASSTDPGKFELTQGRDKIPNVSTNSCGNAGARCDGCSQPGGQPGGQDCCAGLICCADEGSPSCTPRSACRHEVLCRKT